MKQLLIVLLTTLFPLLAQAMALPLPGPITHKAIHDGAWNNPNTWDAIGANTPSIPGDSAVVQIPDGKLVTLTSEETARLKFLQIEGTFRMTIHSKTRLLVETIQVSPTGQFLIGAPGYPVKPGKTAEIVFISDGNPIDHAWDPLELSRGLLSMGKIAFYGQPVTHMSEMQGSAVKGQSFIDLGIPVPTDWKNNDSIVLTSSYFHRNEALQDEVFEIDTTQGNLIFLKSTLQHDHLRVRTDMHLHVANLTRNIIFKSESPDLAQRGHIMFMTSDVDIRYASFNDLGRTNKNVPLNEKLVDLNTGTISDGPATNRRGRYPIHFHKNGILAGQAPPSKVIGSVVRRTPGWGFVNHSSHVNFKENVCHDFIGAGFVTEDGDELGNFFDNIAVHGVGEDLAGSGSAPFYDQKYKPARLNFGNPYRPQVISDFAFSGEGFWFQGPAIRARNNVANSCNGAGMLWFTTGAINIANNQYVGFPKSSLKAAYQGFPGIDTLEARTWNHSPDQYVISDLPILECNGLDAYGCFVGFKLRFNNFDNNAFYLEANRPWNYAQNITPVPGQNNAYAKRLRQEVENLNLWNNEEGFRMRYVERTDFKDVKNINRLDYHPVFPYTGAEFLFVVEDISFDNIITSGYAVAGWAVSNAYDNSNQITYSNRNYSSFSNAATLKASIPCSIATGIHYSHLTDTSVKINWDVHPDGLRFLIRYKPEGSQKWKFVNPTGAGSNFVDLVNLISNTQYVYQINVGCLENVSYWSGKRYFTTDASSNKRANFDPQYDIQAYPNPLTGTELFLKVSGEVEIDELLLYNSQGLVVGRWSGKNRRLALERDLAAGIYLLKVVGQSSTRTMRIVKR